MSRAPAAASILWCDGGSDDDVATSVITAGVVRGVVAMVGWCCSDVAAEQAAYAVFRGGRVDGGDGG